jgi:hypothetical protein
MNPMTTPIDPAAVEAELKEAEEIFGKYKDCADFTTKTALAFDCASAIARIAPACRALLAELAQARAAVEVAEAMDVYALEMGKPDGDIIEGMNASMALRKALDRYRAAKAGTNTRDQE